MSSSTTEMLMIARAFALAAFAAACSLTYAATSDTPAPARTAGLGQLDKNGDGVVSREEASVSPRLAESFDRLDTNKDAVLSLDELRAGRRAAHHGQLSRVDTNNDGAISRDEAKSSARLTESFDTLDANKDGLLSADELRAGRSRAHHGPHGHHGHHARIDTNKDGTISRDEAGAAPRLAENFDAMDANKDGMLTRDELTAWRLAQPKTGAPNPPVAPVKP
jgi:Ca2+-binding EF-hand superfamily protein